MIGAHSGSSLLNRPPSPTYRITLLYCLSHLAYDATGGTKKAPKGNKRIVLSLKLKRLVNGLTAAGLAEGQVVPAVVKSVEDRGYSLSFGIKVRSWCENEASNLSRVMLTWPQYNCYVNADVTHGTALTHTKRCCCQSHLLAAA